MNYLEWIVISIVSTSSMPKLGKSKPSLLSNFKFESCLGFCLGNVMNQQGTNNFCDKSPFSGFRYFKLWTCVSGAWDSSIFTVSDPRGNTKCHPKVELKFRTLGSSQVSVIGSLHELLTVLPLCMWCFVCECVGCSDSSHSCCEWSGGTRGLFTAGKWGRWEHVGHWQVLLCSPGIFTPEL